MILSFGLCMDVRLKCQSSYLNRTGATILIISLPYRVSFYETYLMLKVKGVFSVEEVL
jgi:hypothetical protein